MKFYSIGLLEHNFITGWCAIYCSFYEFSENLLNKISIFTVFLAKSKIFPNIAPSFLLNSLVQTYFELASLNLDKKWWFFSMINSTENHKRNQCSQLVLEMVTESENRQNRADNILLEKTWGVIFWSISLHFTFVSSFFPYQTHHSTMYIFWSPNMFLNVNIHHTKVL